MDCGGITVEENVTAKDFWAGVNAMIYRICHHRHVCYKFQSCGNSHNEVTNCTVSSQHFGVQMQCWKRLPAPAFWIIRWQHQSPNITLMQMSVWLWACLCLVIAHGCEALRLEKELLVISSGRSSFKMYSKYSPDMNAHLHHHHHHYPHDHHHHNHYVNMLQTFWNLDPGRHSRLSLAFACAYFSVFWERAAAINTGLIGIFISLGPIWSEYDEVSARSHLFKRIVVIAVIIMGSLASSVGLLSLAWTP